MDEKTMLSGENAKIKVVGVGGGGGNAVNRMIEDGFTGAEFLVINTDKQALDNTQANKILIGPKATRGLGAGANPEVGRKAAEENREEIKEALQGADLLYIAVGMGGGTGTGASPVVAEIARELGILTIGIITLPFQFEGKKRMKQALEKGKKELSKSVDTLITIPNDKILESLDEKERQTMPMVDAFKLADSVLSKATIGVSSLINEKGHVNLDFADIRTVVKVGGSALMGIGEAKGENAAIKAAQEAMVNPLLSHGIQGAKGVIMNFTSAETIPFFEITKAASLVEENVDEEAEILFGHVIAEGEDWDDEKVRVTIVATGFDDSDTVYSNERKVIDYEEVGGITIPTAKAAEPEDFSLEDSIEEEKRNFENLNKLHEEYSNDELNIPAFLRANK